MEAGHVIATTSRRSAFLGGLCLCCLRATSLEAGTARLQEVADGVFVRRGVDADATVGNGNGIANIGFIIGKAGVLVTDAGGSVADGQWLRSEIRKRTDKPITHIVVTHVHPDHSFGTAAFDQDRPSIVGHHRLNAALTARGEFYRQRLVEILGPANTGRIVLATEEVGPDGLEIDLGQRIVRFTAHAMAHTDCDLSMIDTTSGLLFTGDLLFVGRVPSLDGSLMGWLDELRRLESLGARQAVPGHGPTVVDLSVGAAGLGRYLAVLRDETRDAIQSGLSIEEAVEKVGRTEQGKWLLFDDYHGRNVIQAYRELEWE
jgi:quinoprotein relay system zinc metallohydrolase 2